MRQVHQQADPRGGPVRRGRVGLLAGLAADEAVLPHRLPTETDEDTLGIAELARNCVEIGRQHHKRASVTVSRRRLRAQAVHPFQWFGQNTVDELRRKVDLLRDDAAPRPRACSSSGTTRRPRSSRASRSRGDRRLGAGHRGRVARRRHVPGVERALRPRAVGGRHGRPRALDRLVRPPPPHRGRGAARGTTSRPASTGTSSGRTGATRSPRAGRGLPVDALLRLRGLHRLRHRARRGLADPARGRQPGHGPGPEPGGEVPVTLLGAGHGSRRTRMRVRLRFTKRARSAGPAIATSRACGSAPSGGPSCRSRTARGFSPRPKVSFGLALSTGARVARRSTSTSS